MLVGLECGQDDHVRRSRKAAEGRRGGNAVHPGHPDVHQDDIGSMRHRGRDGVGAVGSLAHHLQLL
jgi:hypothetical protein